ncbi:NUDT8 protein, partial [Piaya cayana]|nr:NUDT8 protein [Piaya cayana]
SFPGGRRDPADRDAAATALRETREELGLRLPEDAVWGQLREIPDRVTGEQGGTGDAVATLVTPRLPSPQVEEFFTLSLEHLLREENQGYTHFRSGGRYSYTLPVFLNGPHRVWGLTAIVTELTLELLAPGRY